MPGTIPQNYSFIHPTQSSGGITEHRHTCAIVGTQGPKERDRNEAETMQVDRAKTTGSLRTVWRAGFQGCADKRGVRIE